MGRLPRPSHAEAPRARRGGVPRRNVGPLLAPSPASWVPLVAKLIAECAEPSARIDDTPLDALLERIGDARVVVRGEATHGTSEFYRMRTRITQELILRRGFRAVAVEVDWLDAATDDRSAAAGVIARLGGCAFTPGRSCSRSMRRCSGKNGISPTQTSVHP